MGHAQSVVPSVIVGRPLTAGRWSAHSIEAATTMYKVPAVMNRLHPSHVCRRHRRSVADRPNDTAGVNPGECVFLMQASLER